MSTVDKNSWPEAQGGGAVNPDTNPEVTKPTATRPTLVAPPARPVRPTPPAKPVAPVAPAVTQPVVTEPAFDPEAYRHLPIAPPSEPMQYRAIGLVRGTYIPTEPDQINRGNLSTEDGLTIDAVLLGRVTSLVKKHLDLAVPHLWVVYPRTRREGEENDDQDLHLQIVGVWEPETLGLSGDVPKDADADGADGPETVAAKVASPQPTSTRPAQNLTSAPVWPTVETDCFSVRGEVVKCEPEQEMITVKILQGLKRTPGGVKSFKLTLQGQIEGRTVGYFWDFQVKRNAKLLTVETASLVGIVPPKKRPKGGTGTRRPGGKPAPRNAAASHSPGHHQGSPRPKKVIADRSTADRKALD